MRPIPGAIVLSTDFGRGEVKGIHEMFDGKEDYFAVECGSSRMINYFPLKNAISFRYLATKENLEAALKLLSEEVASPDFPSKKDRISYFKDAFKTQDINAIAKVLCELNNIDDLGAIESKLYDKLIETLALEAKIVFEITPEEAKNLVLNRLSGQIAKSAV